MCKIQKVQSLGSSWELALKVSQSMKAAYMVMVGTSHKYTKQVFNLWLTSCMVCGTDVSGLNRLTVTVQQYNMLILCGEGILREKRTE